MRAQFATSDATLRKMVQNPQQQVLEGKKGSQNRISAYFWHFGLSKKKKQQQENGNCFLFHFREMSSKHYYWFLRFFAFESSEIEFYITGEEIKRNYNYDCYLPVSHEHKLHHLLPSHKSCKHFLWSSLILTSPCFSLFHMTFFTAA